ncbi:MAG: YmfQ family protein [Bdellovibrionales bacterium]
MSAPSFTVSDFKRALKALLPRGRVWPSEEGTIQDQLVSGLAVGQVRITSRANNLLKDAFPATALELLTDWEKTLALPDSDLPAPETLQARHAFVVAKFIGLGGQSVSYYKRYAKRLGYEIEVRQYTPFRAGQSCAGDPVCSQEWAHRWDIITNLNTKTLFRAGLSCAGEPLAYWNDEVLEKALEKVKPAHTVLRFFYIEEEE